MPTEERVLINFRLPGNVARTFKATAALEGKRYQEILEELSKNYIAAHPLSLSEKSKELIGANP
jgi:hypothetical protein